MCIGLCAYVGISTIWRCSCIVWIKVFGGIYFSKVKIITNLQVVKDGLYPGGCTIHYMYEST